MEFKPPHPITKWDRDTVMGFIEACRRDKGIPIFKTRFAGVPIWSTDHKNVLAVCWGGEGNAPDSVIFTDVPEEDFYDLERRIGDWRYLTMKYAGMKKLKELLEIPVRVYGGGWRLIPTKL